MDLRGTAQERGKVAAGDLDEYERPTGDNRKQRAPTVIRHYAVPVWGLDGARPVGYRRVLWAERRCQITCRSACEHRIREGRGQYDRNVRNGG